MEITMTTITAATTGAFFAALVASRWIALGLAGSLASKPGHVVATRDRRGYPTCGDRSTDVLPSCGGPLA